MNSTIKDATVKIYHYDDLEDLKANVLAVVAAYNFAKHFPGAEVADAPSDHLSGLG